MVSNLCVQPKPVFFAESVRLGIHLARRLACGLLRRVTTAKAVLVAAGICAALPAAQAQPARPFPTEFTLDPNSPWQRHIEGKLTPRSPGVFVGFYRGWSNSILLQATNDSADAIVVPDVGGRVLHYGVGGDNILFEPGDGAGRTLARSSPGFPVGGYQCDVGPESAGLPEHPHLWQGRHTWQSPGEWTVLVASGKDSVLGVEISKSIRLDPETGTLHFIQWLENKLAREPTLCLRDRTLCKSGGFVLLPLNKKSRFSAGWSLRRKSGAGFSYDGATPFSPQVRVIEGVLVARTDGEPIRLGADSDAGWVAYTRGPMLFVKFFAHTADGAYSDGNSVEISWNAQSVELEPRSPEVRLRRFNPYGFAGRWMLLPLDKPVASFDQARALADRIAALKDASGKLDVAARGPR